MARGSLRPCPGGDACRGYVSGDGVTSPLGLDAVLPCGGPLGVSACTHVTRHRDRNAWARSEVARSWLEVLGAFLGDTMSGWKTRASLLLPGTIPSTGKPRPASLGVGEFL